VVNLGLPHPALPVGIIKELKNCLKSLIRIVHNIGKPSALIVFEERMARDGHTWQNRLQLSMSLLFDRQNLNLQFLQLQIL